MGTKISAISLLLDRPIALAKDDLHLWLADFSVRESEGQSFGQNLFEVLSPEEQGRAQRYRSKNAARQFVMVRALLRALLGQYLQQDPASLEFCYSANGKPALTENTGGEALQFNLSHSQGRVLYAITAKDAVGVDIEALNPEVNYLRLAHRVCTAQEHLKFKQLPPAEQCAAFFRLWTCKEAVIKLFGDRLYQKLSMVEVPIQAEAGGFWIQVEDKTVWLQELEVGAGFAGAIALSKCPQCITQQEWDWRTEVDMKSCSKTYERIVSLIENGTIFHS